MQRVFALPPGCFTHTNPPTNVFLRRLRPLKNSQKVVGRCNPK